MIYKRCLKKGCGNVLPLTLGFHKNKQYKDGYHPYCKECRNIAGVKLHHLKSVEKALKRRDKLFNKQEGE